MNQLTLLIVILALYSVYSHSHARHNEKEKRPASTKKLRELVVTSSVESKAPKDIKAKEGKEKASKGSKLKDGKGKEAKTPKSSLLESLEAALRPFSFEQADPKVKLEPKVPDVGAPKSPSKSDDPLVGKGKAKGKDAKKGKDFNLENYQYIKKDGKKSQKNGKTDVDVPEKGVDSPVLPRPEPVAGVDDDVVKEKIDEGQMEGVKDDPDKSGKVEPYAA